MSRWKDQLDNHQIHAVLAEMKKCVAGELADADANEVEERLRFEKIISTCEHILKRADPDLLPFNQLESLFQQMNAQVLPQVRTYRDNGNVGSLRAANDQISNLLPQLAMLHSSRTRGGDAKLSKLMQQQLEAFAKAVEKKQEEIEESTQELDSDISILQKNLSQLEEKHTKLNDDINAQLAQWQQQFSQAQEERNKDYNTWRIDIEKNARDSIEKITKRIESELVKKQNEYDSQIATYLEQAEEKHQAILELYHLAAKDSISGGYMSNANKEGKTADRWRWLSLTFIVLSAAWLFFKFWNTSGEITWQSALSSLPLTGVLLFGATYSAQQSTRHRNIENRNRRFALEMAAIDPYLQSLEPADRQTLKKELTKKFFGQPDIDDNSTPLDEHMMGRVLKSVSENIIKPLGNIAKILK